MPDKKKTLAVGSDLDRINFLLKGGAKDGRGKSIQSIGHTQASALLLRIMRWLKRDVLTDGLIEADCRRVPSVRVVKETEPNRAVILLMHDPSIMVNCEGCAEKRRAEWTLIWVLPHTEGMRRILCVLCADSIPVGANIESETLSFRVWSV